SKQLVKESHTTSFIQQQHEYDGWSEILEIDEDEVISEEASPEFLEELKSIGEKKVLTITDHHIMEATLNDTIRNQYKIATEEEDLMSLIHEKEAPIFFGPQRDPNEPPSSFPGRRS
ncbi:hypothetical protein Tco_0130456, partial [Tanacetum coccineum]